MISRKSILSVLAYILLFFAGMSGNVEAAPSTNPDLGERVSYSDETGMLSFIGSSSETGVQVAAATAPGMLPVDRVGALLGTYAPLFGENNPAENLEQTSLVHPRRGEEIYRYQQTYQGIPILGSELILEMTTEGGLLSMSGELSPEVSLVSQPQITPQQAAQTALREVASTYKLKPENLKVTLPELWVYDERLLRPSDRPVELVWRIEVSALDKAPLNALVLVNAARGGISLQFNQVDTFWQADNSVSEQQATQSENDNTTIYPAAALTHRYETYDGENTISTTTLPGTLLCTEAQPGCTNGTDPHADKAHEYALDALQFYESYHGRNSIDNAGMTVISSVHVGNNFHNAFWDPELQQMVYGDGDVYPMADDIVAHELTHGVTDHESNLFYYYQSGAINESFSDVWGEFIDQTNGAGLDIPSAKWLLGEDLSSGAMRSLTNPPAFGDPDKMTSSNYLVEEGDLPQSGYDNGGVHTNSGVNNKAAVLIADGGSFNGYTVTALGMEKTAAIYYEVQTNRLTSGSDYKDLYYAMYQGCLSLTGGAEGITTSNCQNVRNALNAVEMNLEPVTGYNPEARLCDPGETPNDVVDIFYDDFEDDPSNWKTESVYPPNVLNYHQWELTTWAAANGVSAFYAADRQTSYLPGEEYTYAEINQSFAIPVTGGTYLHFNHLFGFHDGGDDGGIVQYSTDGGTTWINIWPLFDAGLHYNGFLDSEQNTFNGHNAFINNSHGFVSTRYALDSLIGETDVRFRWVLATDNSLYDFGWIIDDVRIYRCAPRVPEKPTLFAPTSGTADPIPTFLWEKLDYTDDYLLAVWDRSGTLSVLQWFSSADVCTSLFCSTVSPVSLSEEVYSWSIRPKNSVGLGPPSDSASFIVGNPNLNIFSDDFETGDFSQWTRFNTGSGFLYTCSQPSINGSYSACVERGDNDKRKQLIDDTPENETTFNARFNFDINSLSMTTGERFRFMQFKMDAERPAFIVLKYDAGIYSIQLNTLRDDLTKVKTGWVTLPDAPTTIEVEWQRSSAPGADDGYAKLYLGGVLQDQRIGLDNDQIFITSFRMGFTSRLGGKSISGIFNIDDVVTSNFGYIGLP